MFSPNTRFVLTSFLSALPLINSLPSPPPPPIASWTTLPNIPLAPRQEHATVAFPQNIIAILGGVVPLNDFAATTDIMQFYSIHDRTWQTRAPIPRPLNHVNAAVSGGKLYVLGGLADDPNGEPAWRAVPDSWVYDPETDVWEDIAPMPEGEARGSAAVGVYDGKIYLAGGLRTLELGLSRLQDTVDVVSMFDPATGKWLEVPEAAKRIPEGRDHAGAAVVGDKFYVLGGRDHGQLNVKDTVFILDLKNLEGGWTTSEARMPTPRGGVAAGVMGKRVYIFGGEGNQELESGVFNQTEVYDTVKDGWEELAPMRIPRHGTYAVGVGDRIYIPGGGIRLGGAPVADFDALIFDAPDC